MFGSPLTEVVRKAKSRKRIPRHSQTVRPTQGAASLGQGTPVQEASRGTGEAHTPHGTPLTWPPQFGGSLWMAGARSEEKENEVGETFRASF